MKTYHFDTPDLIDIPNNGLWVLSTHWTVNFPVRDGTVYRLDLKPGFTTDGASIPRALWPICGYPDRHPRIAAAIAHDWLYSSKALPRCYADFAYAAISSSLGIPRWRWEVEYCTLRLFGGSAWRSHDTNDKIFADAHGILTEIN